MGSLLTLTAHAHGHAYAHPIMLYRPVPELVARYKARPTKDEFDVVMVWVGSGRPRFEGSRPPWLMLPFEGGGEERGRGLFARYSACSAGTGRTGPPYACGPFLPFSASDDSPGACPGLAFLRDEDDDLGLAGKWRYTDQDIAVELMDLLSSGDAQYLAATATDDVDGANRKQQSLKPPAKRKGKKLRLGDFDGRRKTAPTSSGPCGGWSAAAVCGALAVVVGFYTLYEPL